MEVVSNNFMPGDPRLVQQLVYELKSQGIFDQFRKECIADVDTKPAYQNLSQRVEGSVASFLNQQTWKSDLNKNQLREQLRKSIYESGYLETGVERIVDQVVNPKINTVFLPQVEDVVYRYLGIEKPNRLDIKKEIKIDVADLLPTDLEAVSPESDHMKDDRLNITDSSNVESKLEEDESPPFEPLDQALDILHNDVQPEENSVDSHLSGFSGLQSHDSNSCSEPKICQMELSNQDSQVSHNSSESHLSIVTSEENIKMEICEELESKLLEISGSESNVDISAEKKIVIQKDVDEIKKIEKSELDRKDDKTCEEKKPENKKPLEKKNDDKKSEEKKIDKKHDRKNDDKKIRSSEKHTSKDKKDDKYKKSSSSSSSRDKDKTNSRHSSSSSSRDKSKDKRESKSSSSNGKDREKVEKETGKSEKDRDKSRSFSSSKHSSNKDRDKSSSSSKKESSGKDRDKEKSRSSSSSATKDSKSKSSHNDSKSKSSTDKHKRDDKSSYNGKHSSSSSSIRKDKDKKRDPKKESKDDHYSSKEKKNDRRSTDRDSNDGQSSRQSQSNSFTESSSLHTQKTNQESSNSNSGSGSGDSGNSDQIEHTKEKSPIKTSGPPENEQAQLAPVTPVTNCTDIQKFKYMKPKFASNFEEARKLMKIRKQLAKLERQNQLSLAQIDVSVELPTVNGITYTTVENDNEEVAKVDDFKKELITSESKEDVRSPAKDVTQMLPSTELSKENWEALEARLAQEMSNVNYNSYESPYDYDYDCAGYNSIVISPRKKIDKYQVKEENIEKFPVGSKSCELNCEVKKESETEELAEVNKLPKLEVIIKKDLKNFIEKTRKLRVELEPSFCNNSKGMGKIMEKREKYLHENAVNKSGEENEQEIVAEKLIECNEKDLVSCENERSSENVSDTNYECRYLETPSPGAENMSQFIHEHIKKLERDVEHSVKTYQNNFLSVKRGRKRKLDEIVDVIPKNNNKAHYEQTTDISPNDSFSLPLSPAESDKSNDKKEDESPKLAKQKRNAVSRNTARSQRYSSDDLYKPRPIIASTRRSRGIKNQGN